MKIQKGDKVVIIPAWLLVIGALVVDNIATNVLKVKVVKSLSKE